MKNTLATGTAILLLMAAAASPAHAQASSGAAGDLQEPPSQSSDYEALGNSKSCGWAAGPAGTRQCVHLSTYENFVGWAGSEYVTGWGAVNNMCDRAHGIKFKKKGDSSYTYYTRYLDTCLPPVLFSSYHEWEINTSVQSGSQVCARSKNSYTNDVWTSWRCQTVYGTI